MHHRASSLIAQLLWFTAVRAICKTDPFRDYGKVVTQIIIMMSTLEKNVRHIEGFEGFSPW